MEDSGGSACGTLEGAGAAGTGELVAQMAAVEVTLVGTTSAGGEAGGMSAAGALVGSGSARVTAGGAGVLGAMELDQHDEKTQVDKDVLGLETRSTDVHTGVRVLLCCIACLRFVSMENFTCTTVRVLHCSLFHTTIPRLQCSNVLARRAYRVLCTWNTAF